MSKSAAQPGNPLGLAAAIGAYNHLAARRIRHSYHFSDLDISRSIAGIQILAVAFAQRQAQRSLTIT
jgi:hypothetical protein